MPPSLFFISINNILFLDITSEKYHPVINDFINNHLMKKGNTPIFECEYISKNGKTIFVEQCLFLVRNKLGAPTDICVSLKDITLRKRSEIRIQKLKKEIMEEKKKIEEALNIDKKMSSIFDLNHLIDFIVDKSAKILNARKCSLMIYDKKNKELFIKGAKGLSVDVIKNTRVEMGSQICGMVAKRKRAILVENIENDRKLKRKSKKQYRTKSFMIAPIIAHNNLLGIVNVSDKRSKKNQSDAFNEFDLKIFSTIINQAGVMIENANYYRELEYLTTIDSLSNIYNHRYFIKYINNEIKRISRYKSPLSIIMLDIDNFMDYNEVYGRDEGDNLIKNLGRLLKNTSREVDVACRYAGDEFVLILPATDVTQANFVALKILKMMKKLKAKRQISVSIGVAGYSEGIKSSDLILKSYQALYNAKKQYRNKVCCLK